MDEQRSGAGGTLSPTPEERMALRDVGHQSEEARLDGVRYKATRDLNQIANAVGDCARLIRNAEEGDWHAKADGLRGLITVGSLAHELVQLIERELLPQRDRLPGF